MDSVMMKRLQQAVDDGGNLVNLGRSLEVRDPDLFRWVVKSTPFLDEKSKFTQRVYSLLHGHKEVPSCPFTGKPLRFFNFNRGYASTNIASSTATRPVLSSSQAGLTQDDIAYLKEHAQNMVGTNWQRNKPDLYLRLMKTTESFGDANTSERLYCIVNDISIRPDRFYLNFTNGYPSLKEKPDADRSIELEFASRVGSSCYRQGRKVRDYLKRNRAVSAALYDLDLSRAGIDFVVCPVLGTRMLNIKRPYVEGVLAMPWDEFRAKHPQIAITCSAHARSIAAGLEILDENGLTKHAVSVIAATATRSLVGDDGLSINDRKGRKVRESHLAKIDANGLNGYQRIAAVARRKQHITMSGNNLVAHPDSRAAWLLYRNFNIWLTYPLKHQILSGKPTGRAGVTGAWHVDHVYSIIGGFHMNISPWCISHIENLVCIKWEENCQKSGKINDPNALGILFSNTSYDESRSSAEMNFWKQAVAALKPEERNSINIYRVYNELTNGTILQNQRAIRNSKF